MSDELKPLAVLGQIVDSFPDDVRESLWDQGVNMDDWDYAILVSPDTLTAMEDGEGYHPREWALESMLHGVCDSTWYRATIRGQEYGIGIAYHS